MRDPSEVIADMNRAVDAARLAAATGAEGSVPARYVEAWARELSTPQPASADVDDAMVERALNVLTDHGVLSILTDYESDKAATRAALLAAIKGDSHAG